MSLSVYEFIFSLRELVSSFMKYSFIV